LTDATITAAGIHTVRPADIAKITAIAQVESLLEIPYGDGFSRYKVFPAGLRTKNGTFRYLQPDKTGAHLYLPPTLPPGILQDPTKPLGIAEGEKKALKGTQDGLPCVGIGGLWNWLQHGRLLETFEAITLQGRTVTLWPDSDVWRRQGLLAAVYRLGAALEARGAHVLVKKLPDGPGKVKQGLDDFLVAYDLDTAQRTRTYPLTDPIFAKAREAAERVHVNGHRSLGQADNSAEGDNREVPLAIRPWPQMEKAAFIGLAGEFVRVIEPHTEADPVSLLIEFLLAYGNVIGRRPHCTAEADYHAFNENAVLVGNTAKGRKGSSWGHVRRVCERVDEVWADERILSGLSSGEGLIANVRDAKGEDAGVSDKRLFVIEQEFSSTLRVLNRDGNTLSAMLRQAWDGGTLQTLSKNSPMKASGAHISILGHITGDELLRHLHETEAGNGFGNRFLWVCVRCSKELPEGGKVELSDLNALIVRLKKAVDFARAQDEIRRDEQARRLWHEVYHDLSEARPGLLGHMVARAEAHVMRLSGLYALLDQSPVVGIEHLDAALAVWQYCEASARYIFGDSLGDAVADDILAMLRASGQTGMSRTAISEHFGRNKPAAELSRALAKLLELRLVELKDRDTGGKRKAEVWYAKGQIRN
jgi:hypothetical protein